MAGERMTRMRLAPAAVILGAAATLAACDTAPADSQTGHEITQPSPSTFSCDAARYILTTGQPDYLIVHLTDTKNKSALGDSVDINVLDGHIKKHLDLHDNQVDIALPQTSVQVAVTVTKDGESHACPTIFYPFKQLDEIK